MYRPKFRLMNPEPDAGGTGTVDRGDLLQEDKPVVAPATTVEDPAVKALADSIVAEKATEIDAGDEAGADEGAKKKGGIIPLDRHQAVLDKERAKSAALAAEIAQLKQRGAVEADATTMTAALATMEAEVVTLETEYAQLLTDGELKKAATVMAKIRATERTMSDQRADMKIQVATLQAAETSRYTTALGRVEAAYPVLNPEHESFDEKTEARVARMSRANQAAGMTPTAALQDAVETVLGAETPAQERATTVTPRVDPKDVAAARKAAAVAKTVDAVGATPPSLAKVGEASDKDGAGALTAEAVAKMSQKEFAALSEGALAKLRGDTV